MGLPDIFISFETAAVSAIQRSSRGVLALVIGDLTETNGYKEEYQSLAEVPEELYIPENYRLLQLVFKAAPAKVIVLRTKDITIESLAAVQADWVAAPGMDNSLVISYIKDQRAKGRNIKAVLADAKAPDCEGIVNLCVEDLVLEDGPIEGFQYTARIASLLASMPLTRSATYASLPEVVSCAAYDDPDAEVDAGKLIIVSGRDGYRLGRAVNSLTTLTPEKAAPFQKIKIVEGIDLIRTDIATAFESGYIGKVLNDYDNKLLLVTAINSYLSGLMGDVLDKTAENRCYVSLAGQKAYLESQGIDTSGMKDAEILRANTGSQVFLEATLTFCDAMEDLSLAIAM